MNDAEYAAARERVLALADRWVNRLGLTHWAITYKLHREPIPGWPDRLAAVDTQWPYMVATIEFSMPMVADAADAFLEKEFLHECCHILVAELCPPKQNKEQRDHEERVVTMLAYAIQNTRDDALEKQHEPG